jgi:hypothetical protein
MCVAPYLGFSKHCYLSTKNLTREMCISLMHGHAPLQVRQSHVGSAIPSVGCPDDREKRCMLGNRHDLSIAESPSARGVIPAKYANLGYERL